MRHAMDYTETSQQIIEILHVTEYDPAWSNSKSEG